MIYILSLGFLDAYTVRYKTLVELVSLIFFFLFVVLKMNANQKCKINTDKIKDHIYFIAMYYRSKLQFKLTDSCGSCLDSK